MGLSIPCLKPFLAFLTALVHSLLFRQTEQHLGDATQPKPVDLDDLCADEPGVPSYLELLRVNGKDVLAPSVPRVWSNER